MTLSDIIREEEQKKQEVVRQAAVDRSNAEAHAKRVNETIDLRLKSLDAAISVFAAEAEQRGLAVFKNTKFLAAISDTHKGEVLKVVKGDNAEVVIVTCSQCEDQIVYNVEVFLLGYTWLLRREKLAASLYYKRCENSEQLLRFLTVRYLV
jgi:hypothetical protein